MQSINAWVETTKGIQASLQCSYLDAYADMVDYVGCFWKSERFPVHAEFACERGDILTSFHPIVFLDPAAGCDLIIE